MIIWLFVIVVVVLIGHSMLKAFTQGAQTSGSITGQPLANLQWNVSMQGATWDKVIFGLFVMISLVLIIGSALIDTVPVLFIFSLIVYIILSVVIMGIANSAQTVMDSFGNLIVEYPLTTWLFQNILISYLVVGAIIMMVLYGKARNG
jgi:hypothetical protein